MKDDKDEKQKSKKKVKSSSIIPFWLAFMHKYGSPLELVNSHLIGIAVLGGVGACGGEFGHA